MGVNSRVAFEPDVAAAASPAGRGLGRHLGLSGRLFLLTVAFVALVEVLVYVPTVANYRRMWLSDRIAAAQVAALVLDAAPDQHVSERLAQRLLAGVGARAIAVKGNGTRRLLADETVPEAVSELIDLREINWITSIRGLVRTLLFDSPLPVRVIGHGRDDFDLVEILIDPEPFRDAVAAFAIRLALSSLAIAAAVAGLIFLILQRAIVRPVRRLVHNITEFAEDPEAIDGIMVPSRRTDEIGHAEIALGRMETALAGELREKRRLAGLGLSVSKINHELRNLLTTAQLLSDRLDGVADPLVQRVAPRLVLTLDRAIRFCEETLAYGRATERNPNRRLVALAPIIAEQADLSGRERETNIVIREVCPKGLRICVDPEQFSRALANIVRNAVQALAQPASDHEARARSDPTITIEARRGATGIGAATTILVADNGPGLPARAREHLFSPFKGSSRSGGTGLGLAIASELIQLNGGTLTLDETAVGTCFRIVIPDPAV
ncbi:sensor histidine kinase [Methylobacterium sp. J-068]|uniref:sensor histidine kinase n=1 Tax=Methylobacterium sp. J-068 TaxID=2836649 RepID=UPI001FBBC0F2|nr:HAMP domain-containing sensor histidine kinase [Methylobacterium sp. J-068]MCJ2037221.1 HAMP domain-containing histidine kinase [Methylobacterium sp. J-068]